MTTDPQDPASSHVLVVLFSQQGPPPGSRHALEPSPAVTTVGRKLDNTIVLDRDAVSRYHARFEQRSDGWWVVDVGSTNGTWVNGQQVESAQLHRGDRIHIGHTVFQFRRADAPSSSVRPIDVLAEMHDRRYLVFQIDRQLRPAETERRPLALLHLVVDDYSGLTSMYGDSAGQRALAEVVSLARQQLGPDDVLARYHGEELALLLPGTELEGAAARAEALRTAVAARTFVLDDRTTSITVSVGVAIADEHTSTAEGLIHAAGRKLAAARIGAPALARDPRRLAEYSQRDDERPFLDQASRQRLDDAGRMAYAELLADRDPERAEWLRLEVGLHSRATDDPAVLARFIALARKIGMDFANMLLREKILNCGNEDARHAPPRVRFAFTCTKRWETLAPTDAESVRFCQQCKEQVYHCDTTAEAASRALAGQCIALPRPLTDGGLEIEMLGRPDPIAMWAEHLFPIHMTKPRT